MRSGSMVVSMNRLVGFLLLKKIDRRYHILMLGASMSQFMQHQCDSYGRIHISVTRLQVAASALYFRFNYHKRENRK